MLGRQWQDVRCEQREHKHFGRNNLEPTGVETDVNALRPTNPRTHWKQKRGRCTLCGTHTVLTKTHVPPKAAFNDGPASMSAVDSDNMIVQDQKRDGGLHLRAHCEPCRRATSSWDDEYIKWAGTFVKTLVESPLAGQRQSLTGTLVDVRPGRFARAALAGMTALAEGLIDSHPDFVAAIREDQLWAASDGMRLLAAITTDEQAIVSGGHQGASVSISLDGSTSPKTVPTLSAVVHLLPFSLVLADASIANNFLHVDCTDWLKYRADDVVHNFDLNLPIVKLSSDSAIIYGANCFEGGVA